MRKIFLLGLIIIGNLFSINKPVLADNNYITVATAANVQFAMGELKKEFNKQTGIEIKTVLSSSGKLTAQINNGAPFDVFMSADMNFPQKLYDEGFATTKPKTYAYGTLVLWTMKDLDLSDSISLLKSDKVVKIALANPKTAPYGQESVNSLNYYKIFDQVKNKIVYAESISQVNNYISSMVADIGFTSKSVVISPEMKGKGKWVNVDKKAYKAIAQGVVILKYGKENNRNFSQKFYDFLFSKKARQIFEKYGYISGKR
jgi:molybdate transport system substrate-binding protein